MPVIKVKELPAYYGLLDEVWRMRFHTSLAADKNLIENRKVLRQEIAQRFGLYAGEFDSKRFEDVFNGVRNTEYDSEHVLESAIPISNYPGIELLEAYCHIYYQLNPPSHLNAFKDSAKTGKNWNRFLSDYYSQHASNAVVERAGTPKDFKVWGVNLCSGKQVTIAAGALLTGIWLIGLLIYQCIQWQYVPQLTLPGSEIDPGQKGYLLSLSVASLIQSLIILALLGLYYYEEDIGGAHYIKSLPKGIVKTTLQQFQGGWITIWISLLFLYLWFAFKWNVESSLLDRIEYEQSQGHQALVGTMQSAYLHFRALSWVIADIFNLVGGSLYFYLYFILDTESIAAEEDPKDGPARNQFFTTIMKAIFGIAVLLLAGSTVDRLVNLNDYQGLPTLLYSLFTSIAMAMFFGRLNSHFFNSSPAARVFFVPLFYLYAALQAVYSMLGFKNVHISVSLIVMVFVLKIILFFYISKLINKRKFDGYITNMIHQLASEKQHPIHPTP